MTCESTYSFRHKLNFTSDANLFVVSAGGFTYINFTYIHTYIYSNVFKMRLFLAT